MTNVSLAAGALPTAGSLVSSGGTSSTLFLAAPGNWVPGMVLYKAGTAMGTTILSVSGTTLTTAAPVSLSAGSTVFYAGAPVTLKGGTLL